MGRQPVSISPQARGWANMTPKSVVIILSRVRNYDVVITISKAITYSNENKYTTQWKQVRAQSICKAKVVLRYLTTLFYICSILLLFPTSLWIHISVVIVYVGIKSPIMGMNLIKLIAADLLFLVIANNKPVTNAFGISPIRGTLKIGSPRKSTVSAIIDMTSAKRDLFQSNDSAFFSFSSHCMICY